MNDDLKNITEEEWKEKLTPEQYKVLRQKGTEAPFTGKFYHNKEGGMYVCGACGQELFSSDTKFDSGTGWPSFTQPMKSQVYFVYVLRMNNSQLYVGSTNNLLRRVTEHKNGKVLSTKKYLPVSLIHYEEYGLEGDARNREKMLKYHGSAFAKLKNKILDNKEISLAGFTDPVNKEHVELRTDTSHGMIRTEVLCQRCGSHLGHVFPDLPAGRQAVPGHTKSGQRYCINSCALDFKKK